MAIAPPLGFTWGASSGTFNSRRTARAWDAKASFSSITSIWEMFRPVLAKSFLLAGAGPMPMMRGATPAVAEARTRAFGVKPCFFTAASDARRSAQAQSMMPEAVPAVMVPSGFTTPFNLERASSVVSGSWMFIHGNEKRIAFFLRDGHGEDFFGEASGFLCGGGSLLAAEGEGVLIGAGDVKFFGYDFTGLGHRVGAVFGFESGIHEAPAERGVFEFQIARERGVGFAEDERGAGHAFDTAGDQQIQFAAFDGAGGDGDGVHAGAAKAIDSCAGNFFRQTSE